jgi:polyhydroxyalkanoate synthesis regulator phasin
MVRKREFLELKARVEILEQRITVLEDTNRRREGVAGEY